MSWMRRYAGPLALWEGYCGRESGGGPTPGGKTGQQSSTVCATHRPRHPSSTSRCLFMHCLAGLQVCAAGPAGGGAARPFPRGAGAACGGQAGARVPLGGPGAGQAVGALELVTYTLIVRYHVLDSNMDVLRTENSSRRLRCWGQCDALRTVAAAAAGKAAWAPAPHSRSAVLTRAADRLPAARAHSCRRPVVARERVRRFGAVAAAGAIRRVRGLAAAAPRAPQLEPRPSAADTPPVRRQHAP